MANCNEGARYCNVFCLAILFFDPYPGHSFFITQDFIKGGVQFKFNLAFSNLCHQSIIQNRLSTELVTAMNHRHFSGNTSKVERFFNGRVATADHTDILAFIKEAIAGSATRYSATHKCLFARQTKVLGRSTR